MFHTVAAKPAFVRIQDNRRLLLFRVGNKDIGAANIDTSEARRAKFRINNEILAGCHRIWNEVCFISHHEPLLLKNKIHYVFYSSLRMRVHREVISNN
jgi:hypothetical protein